MKAAEPKKTASSKPTFAKDNQDTKDSKGTKTSEKTKVKIEAGVLSGIKKGYSKLDNAKKNDKEAKPLEPIKHILETKQVVKPVEENPVEKEKKGHEEDVKNAKIEIEKKKAIHTGEKKKEEEKSDHDKKVD